MANRLIKALSPYLRKSSHQPVDWYEWSEEAFRKAKEEDKPILLSIGGVWCHWCHVMAHESFENEEIAKIINESFVPIKVDRDERPDIDRRYQEVVISLTGSGGWPLTVFLTPDGEAFFGGTYFPPEDRWGRPGFKRILLKISELWKEDKDRVYRSARHISESLKLYYSNSYKDVVGEEILRKGLFYLLSSIDFEKGGIAGAPKFHHAKALEFLLINYYFSKDETIKRALEVSLDRMARGGVYDHLLGGFFRYSTDEDWLVPHFEKMLYDNADLLELYSIAYRVMGKELYAYVCEGIVDYYKLYGYDKEGGFYASQDADIGKLDEGGYYTFTFEELKAVLSPEELGIAKAYFGINPFGHMHGGKNVLHINKTEEELAKELGINLDDLRATIRGIRKKLREYREKREMPFIDKTIYVNWNALMISAMCEYYKTFDDEWARESAIKTAHRLWEEFYKNDQLLHTTGTEGFSEDYVFFAKALVDLFQLEQDEVYLKRAKGLIDRAIELFWDNENWGFFDSVPKDQGLLAVKVKPIQDTPTQSVNGTAPYVMLSLYTLTGEDRYRDYAEKTLQAFSKFINDVPMASHSYMLSLYAYLKGMFKVETKDFFDQMLKTYRPFKLVLKRDVKGIIVCEGNTCNVFENPNGIV